MLVDFSHLAKAHDSCAATNKTFPGFSSLAQLGKRAPQTQTHTNARAHPHHPHPNLHRGYSTTRRAPGIHIKHTLHRAPWPCVPTVQARLSTIRLACATFAKISVRAPWSGMCVCPLTTTYTTTPRAQQFGRVRCYPGTVCSSGTVRAFGQRGDARCLCASECVCECIYVIYAGAFGALPEGVRACVCVRFGLLFLGWVFRNERSRPPNARATDWN